jgi:ABC-type transport system substrate-binding protein
VGIDLQVQKMERGPYLDLVRAYGHHLCASAGTDIDPDQLRIRFGTEGLKVSNFANLSDPQLDALLAKGAQQQTGTPERKKTYEDAQRRLMDILPFVSVLSQVRVEAMSAKLHDLKMGPEGLNALPLTDPWIDQ